jgi:hypothetical protein
MNQPMAHSTPRAPVQANDHCQPNRPISAVQMGSDSAEPASVPELKMLEAKARSCRGNHCDTTLELAGMIGASPSPSSIRSPMREPNPRASATAAVKTPHQAAAAAYMTLPPTRSISQPDATWSDLTGLAERFGVEVPEEKDAVTG